MNYNNIINLEINYVAALKCYWKVVFLIKASLYKKVSFIRLIYN